ncbi:hypothetical protein CNMCM5793_005520 [Aspergillus hiratsukae]|uniref:Uncharacterized protein n=1 Tax=Aspergillus hiratsukae TaxID=1194566 RepID=A0A8H6PHB9_9EURO|nr:hypothetical protein CNMCM5793_005520 [Aspergillus hiratsukae]
MEQDLSPSLRAASPESEVQSESLTSQHEIQTVDLDEWALHVSRSSGSTQALQEKSFNNSLTESKLLDIGAGTRFHGFTGQYILSSKEPDLYLHPDSTTMPSIIIASGWTLSGAANVHEEVYDPDLGFDLVSSLTALQWEGSDDEQEDVESATDFTGKPLSLKSSQSIRRTSEQYPDSGRCGSMVLLPPKKKHIVPEAKRKKKAKLQMRVSRTRKEYRQRTTEVEQATVEKNEAQLAGTHSTKNPSKLIVDGVDGCPERERQATFKILQQLQEHIDVCICLSFRQDAEDHAKVAAGIINGKWTLPIPEDNPDVEAYIDSELHERLDLDKLCIGNPAIILSIQHALVNGAQGREQNVISAGCSGLLRDYLTKLAINSQTPKHHDLSQLGLTQLSTNWITMESHPLIMPSEATSALIEFIKSIPMTPCAVHIHLKTTGNYKSASEAEQLSLVESTNKSTVNAGRISWDDGNPGWVLMMRPTYRQDDIESLGSRHCQISQYLGQAGVHQGPEGLEEFATYTSTEAGMTRSLGASRTKGNILSSNAYQEAYLQPRFGPKRNHQWYDFIDNGGRPLSCDFGYFAPDINDVHFNNKTAFPYFSFI